MRIMAVDYGDMRTGIAISDADGIIVGQAWVIEDWSAESLAGKIAGAVLTWDVKRIVLGYPKNMDGTPGSRAEKSIDLAKLLRLKSGIDVVLWDERRTTIDAHRILSDVGKHGKKRKKTIDAVAASLILESYLESLR